MSRIIRRQGLIIIHIVLTLLALTACASSPPAESSGSGAALSPIASADCETLRAALAQQLESEIAQADAPFSDPIKGGSGTACQLTAKGTGEDFGSFVEVADKIRTTLTEQGWTEDHGYMADGPTGTAAGFRKANALAMMQVEWSPAPEVQCPADQPISACEVPPAQQIFDISLNLAQ